MAKGTSFVGDIFKLASGTAFSDLIGVAAAPLIARLFTPEAFGGLALFAAATVTINTIACARYELAIVLPEDDQEAVHIAWLCVSFVLATTALSAIVVVLAGNSIWSWVKAPGFKTYGWLIPINILFAGLFSILASWNTRQRRFLRLTVLQVVSRIAITGSQILVAFAGFKDAGALIGCTIWATLVTTTVLFVETWKESSRLFLAGFDWQSIWVALKRYCGFPKFSAGAVLLNAASGHVPPVLLSGFFSVAAAGQFSFANRLLRVPGRLIGTSFSQAFFPRVAEAKLEGTLGRSVEVALEYLIKMTMLPCLLLALIGKDLFVVALGKQWAEAGVFAEILSLWLFIWFISSPLTVVLVVLERQDLELRFQSLNIASRVGALAIGGLLGNARLAIALFAACGIVLYGSYCAAVVLKTGASRTRVVKALSITFARSLPAFLIVLATKYYSASHLLALGVSFIVLTVYYLDILRVDPIVRGILSQAARKSWPGAPLVRPPSAS